MKTTPWTINGAETVVPLFIIGFVIWAWSGLASDILEGDF